MESLPETLQTNNDLQSLNTIVKKEKSDDAINTGTDDNVLLEGFFDEFRMDSEATQNVDEIEIKREVSVDHSSNMKESPPETAENTNYTQSASNVIQGEIPEVSVDHNLNTNECLAENSNSATATLTVVKEEKDCLNGTVKPSPQPHFSGIRIKKDCELLLPRSDCPTDNIAEGDGSSTEDDNIPEDFFDDLALDKLQQHFEEENVKDLEVKYSEKLKMLKSLDKNIKKNKKHKKHKKKSKHRKIEIEESCIDGKSRHETKRRRSRSKSPFDTNDCEPRTSSKKSKSSNSIHIPNEFQSLNFVVSNAVSMNSIPQNAKIFQSTPNEEHPFFGKSYCKKESDSADDDYLSLEEKIIRALKITTSLREQLRNKDGDNLPLFQFTNTVRKLPKSTNMYLRKDYEDRSPLNSVNNVEYTFNTNRTQIDLYEYGLERIPKALAKPARIVGLDISALYNKMVNIKIPPTVKLNRSKPKTQSLIADEVEISGSTMFRTKSTQTDCSIFKGNSNSQSVGIQVKPHAYSVGLQTTESGSSSSELRNNFPLMNLVQNMSEEQLFALHDFAEIIMEPPSTNSIDMYKIRQRLLEIYKLSQQPSNLKSNLQPNLLKPDPKLNLHLSDMRFTGEQKTTAGIVPNFNVNDPRLRVVDYNHISSNQMNKNNSASGSNPSSYRRY